MSTAAERKKLKHARIPPKCAPRRNLLGHLQMDRERIMAAGPEIERDIIRVREMIDTAAKGCNRQDMFAASEAHGAVQMRIQMFLSTIEQGPQWTHIDRLRQELKFEFETAAKKNFFCFDMCFTE